MDDRGSGHGLDQSLLVQRSLYLTIEPVIDTPATWSPKSHGCCEVFEKKTGPKKRRGGYSSKEKNAEVCCFNYGQLFAENK